MECKEAQELIAPFVKKELEKEKLESFLQHIRNCSECYEELEFYYTINTYAESQDRDWFTTYDLKGAFEADLKEAEHRVGLIRAFFLFKDLITGFAIVGIIVAVIVQLHGWGFI